jgi:hypothetical protein
VDVVIGLRVVGDNVVRTVEVDDGGRVVVLDDVVRAGVLDDVGLGVVVLADVGRAVVVDVVVRTAVLADVGRAVDDVVRTVVLDNVFDVGDSREAVCERNTVRFEQSILEM